MTHIFSIRLCWAALVKIINRWNYSEKQMLCVCVGTNCVRWVMRVSSKWHLFLSIYQEQVNSHNVLQPISLFSKNERKKMPKSTLNNRDLMPVRQDYFRLGILYANNNFLLFIMITNPTILFLNRSGRYLQTLTTSMSTHWKTKIVSQLVWFTLNGHNDLNSPPIKFIAFHY